MQYEDFKIIMDNDKFDMTRSTDANSALIGLNVIAKYLPNSGVGAAEHDEIWACGVHELLEAGLTSEDAIILSEHNWMIDDESDSLSCFV
jgi:hypothetical protein